MNIWELCLFFGLVSPCHITYEQCQSTKNTQQLMKIVQRLLKIFYEYNGKYWDYLCMFNYACDICTYHMCQFKKWSYFDDFEVTYISTLNTLYNVDVFFVRENV